MAHLVQEWLEWHNIEVKMHPAYSSNFAPYYFWLSPTLKHDLRIRFLESDEKVIHEILKSLTHISEAEFHKMIEEK